MVRAGPEPTLQEDLPAGLWFGRVAESVFMLKLSTGFKPKVSTPSALQRTSRRPTRRGIAKREHFHVHRVHLMLASGPRTV